MVHNLVEKYGRLFLAYSHFYGGSRDESPAYIAGRFSEDKGKTWSKEDVTVIENEGKQNVMSVTLLRFISGEIGFFYAVKNSSSDCRLYMRTDLGCQFRSYSQDRGETWSLAKPTDIISPVSPATVKRIPKTSDLLLIWNDHSGKYPYVSGKRTPLCSAISQDEGKTWKNSKLLENDPDGWYCYASCVFINERAVLSYCAGNSQIGGLNLLQITLVDIDWFYS